MLFTNEMKPKLKPNCIPSRMLVRSKSYLWCVDHITPVSNSFSFLPNFTTQSISSCTWLFHSLSILTPFLFVPNLFANFFLFIYISPYVYLSHNFFLYISNQNYIERYLLQFMFIYTQLGLENMPTAPLLRGKTSSIYKRVMTLNCIWWLCSSPGTLGNMQLLPDPLWFGLLVPVLGAFKGRIELFGYLLRIILISYLKPYSCV